MSTNLYLFIFFFFDNLYISFIAQNRNERHEITSNNEALLHPSIFRISSFPRDNQIPLSHSQQSCKIV